MHVKLYSVNNIITTIKRSNSQNKNIHKGIYFCSIYVTPFSVSSNPNINKGIYFWLHLCNTVMSKIPEKIIPTCGIIFLHDEWSEDCAPML